MTEEDTQVILQPPKTCTWAYISVRVCKTQHTPHTHTHSTEVGLERCPGVKCVGSLPAVTPAPEVPVLLASGARTHVHARVKDKSFLKDTDNEGLVTSSEILIVYVHY